MYLILRFTHKSRPSCIFLTIAEMWWTSSLPMASLLILSHLKFALVPNICNTDVRRSMCSPTQLCSTSSFHRYRNDLASPGMCRMKADTHMCCCADPVSMSRIGSPPRFSGTERCRLHRRGIEPCLPVDTRHQRRKKSGGLGGGEITVGVARFKKDILACTFLGEKFCCFSQTIWFEAKTFQKAC